jgi:hypothetical protein
MGLFDFLKQKVEAEIYARTHFKYIFSNDMATRIDEYIDGFGIEELKRRRQVFQTHFKASCIALTDIMFSADVFSEQRKKIMLVRDTILSKEGTDKIKNLASIYRSAFEAAVPNQGLEWNPYDSYQSMAEVFSAKLMDGDREILKDRMISIFAGTFDSYCDALRGIMLI